MQIKEERPLPIPDPDIVSKGSSSPIGGSSTGGFRTGSGGGCCAISVAGFLFLLLAVLGSILGLTGTATMLIACAVLCFGMVTIL
ncbi:MAG: hypothetical protein FJY66_01795 [Calditrichaeota bacterium]|nr:hypothetical protein [Calditrichota bacterium]